MRLDSEIVRIEYIGRVFLLLISKDFSKKKKFKEVSYDIMCDIKLSCEKGKVYEINGSLFKYFVVWERL